MYYIAIPFEAIQCREILFVAFLAGHWTFFHVGMTTFTAFVGIIFAEAFNLAAGSFGVALGAVWHGSLVSFVIEFHAFFHFNDIG
jgi:hypothetical protein